MLVTNVDLDMQVSNSNSITPRHLIDCLKLVRRINTATYEISSLCNLTCEGCLFFSGDYAAKHQDNMNAESWRQFFRNEAIRGINYAIISGAEPSLQIERIRAAWDAIPAGSIYTNGTKPVPSDIGYQIFISLWGDEETTELTRGANINKKAMTNYAGDERAVFMYTINALNIDEIRPAVRACQEYGVQISFNYFSPTIEHLSTSATHPAKQSDYATLINQDSDISLCANSFGKARYVIEEVLEDYPGTVQYSLAYDAWITGETSPYTLDEQGVATDCFKKYNAGHHLFHIDQSRSSLKCGHPNLDCNQCRSMPAGMAGYVLKYPPDLRRYDQPDQRAKTADWLNVFESWSRLFIGNQVDRIENHRI